MKAIPFLLLLVLARVSFAAEPKVIYEEDPTLLTTTIEVLVLTGSEDDPAGKAGLTSMMAELMLRGTKTRTRTRFQSEIERMGASLSVHAGYDKISFVGRVIKENTVPFLKLLQDALLHPRFAPKQFDGLRTETLADIANLKNSNGRLPGLAIRQYLFADTPLAHTSDGGMKSVKAITLRDIVKAYGSHLNRASMVIAIASPLKQVELDKSVGQLSAGLPEGERKVRTSIALKAPTTPTLLLIEKPKTSTGNLMLAQPGITAQDPARYVLGVGNYTFGGEALVSRLFKVIRGELGWTYAIGSTYHASGALSDQQGFYIISSTPAVEFTTKTLLKLLAMWKDYLDNGLKSDELRLAKESLVNSYPFEFDSAEKRLGQKIHSYLYGVPVLDPDEYAKTIDAVTNDDLKTALKQKQSESGWVIALVADRQEITKQLESEQADVPADKRITISKTLVPDQLVE